MCKAEWFNPLRIGAILFALFPLLYLYDFYEHFYFYLTGKSIIITTRNNWTMVLLSIFSFLLFWIPLTWRRKAKWGEYGLVTGFFVSLFIEMYGIPLSIWLLYTSFAGVTSEIEPEAVNPVYVVNFNHPALGFGMDLAMTYGAVLIGAGVLLICWGWSVLYSRGASGGIVASGLYSWSRHPQYLGFIMIILGWIIGWPSLITLLFGPVLIWKYVKVARVEEEELGIEEGQVPRWL